MPKIIIVLSLLLLLTTTKVASALTVSAGNNYDVMTATSFGTTSTSNYSDTFYMGTYESASFQCAWSSITGTQPQYKLQVSNDGTNWDDYSGALTVTTGTSGSETWILDTIPTKLARVKISTASTTGSLNCVTTAQGSKR